MCGAVQCVSYNWSHAIVGLNSNDPALSSSNVITLSLIFLCSFLQPKSESRLFEIKMNPCHALLVWDGHLSLPLLLCLCPLWQTVFLIAYSAQATWQVSGWSQAPSLSSSLSAHGGKKDAAGTVLTSADYRSPIISSEVHRYKLPDLCDFSKLKSKQELFILPVTEFLRHFCSYHQDCKSFVYWKSEKNVCLCLSWEEEKDSVVQETRVYSGITQLQLTVLLPYQADSTINVRVKSSLLEDKAEESHDYYMPGAASCSVR